jgi:hypothetical protein
MFPNVKQLVQTHQTHRQQHFSTSNQIIDYAKPYNYLTELIISDLFKYQIEKSYLDNPIITFPKIHQIVSKSSKNHFTFKNIPFNIVVPFVKKTLLYQLHLPKVNGITQNPLTANFLLRVTNLPFIPKNETYQR